MSTQNPAAPAAPLAVKKPRGVRTNIQLLNKTIPVYAGKKVSEALVEITANMNVYHGVRFSQILEAVYVQGKKDGARDVFEKLDDVKRAIPHRNPGHPKKQHK